MANKSIVICLTPSANGGEQTQVRAEVAKHPSEKAFLHNVYFETLCHGTHSTSLGLHADMACLPGQLRELADKIDEAMAELNGESE